MVGREELPGRARERLRGVRTMALLSLAVLGAALFRMQVLGSERYHALAEMNSMKRVTVDAPRGLILDREGRVLVKNRPAFDAVIRTDHVVDMRATVERAGIALGLDGKARERLQRRLKKSRHAEEICKVDLSLGEVAYLEARSLEWPEFRVRQGLVRSYPHGTVAGHVLGHMGEIGEEQLRSPAFASYTAGSVIGRTGVEGRYESYLHGRDGSRWIQVDNLGREKRDLGRLDPPVSGLDVRLALDLDVQSAAERAFAGKRGAAFALDLRTGGVLALVSSPAYDPNAFAGRLSGTRWQQYRQDPSQPMYDRALLATLPPGSVFKVIDAIAGLESAAWDPEDPITCNGRTTVHGDQFHCWKPAGHGVVTLHEAMRGSCNVYFYHRGDAVGIERLADWSRKLGLGSPTGVDLDNEGAGLVPDGNWKRREKGEPWWPGETVSVAIGQGALQVSVLQVASVMQIVATEKAWVPQVVTSIGSGGFVRAPRLSRSVRLAPDTLFRLRRALSAVVNEPGGTGGRARIDGYSVSGKTGTAQAPPIGEDVGEHAWFAGYAPSEDPAVVAVVFVERGGHGGETAAPIVRAIFESALPKLGIAPKAKVEVAGRPVAPPNLAAAGLPGPTHDRVSAVARHAEVTP